MAGLSDLFGGNGVLEQLLLWNTLGQVTGASLGPALELLRQDINAKKPVTVADPGTLADLAARGFITVDAGQNSAARNGVDGDLWQQLVGLHTVRLQPADLATLALRSYLTAGQAAAQASPQGVSADMMDALTYLAGDALGPQQLAQAALRGIVPLSGTGPNATSFQQGVAESRLHDKWGPVLYALMSAIISPPDAAEAVVRNFMSTDDGAAAAAKSGVPAALFATMVHLAGDAPGPQQLAEALRRAVIPAAGTGPDSTSFAQGIAEGRLADKWAPVIQALSLDWPTPDDALNAMVKGAFTAAEGQQLYERLGGDPQFYEWLLWSIGDSPTPLEAAAMAARGIIAQDGTGPGVLSYQQAVKESRYRDKWAAAYQQLAQGVPSPADITTWLSEQLITQDQATAWLLDNNLAPDVAAAYVALANWQAVSGYRGLAQSDIITMYEDRYLSGDQATQLLSALHMSAEAVKITLEYADLRFAIASVTKSVSRIETLFTGRKISAQTAADSLTKLGVPVSTIDAVIADWEITAAASVKTLTATQIAEAFSYGVLAQDEAMAELGNIGYTPFDAWVLLGVEAKAPQPGKPQMTVAASPGAIIPGLT
jgi:hypothetical protein